MADRHFEQAARKLGKTLKRRRTDLGLTQEVAAERAGLILRHYQKLEAGEVNVTLRTLVKLASAFGIDLPSLMG